MAVREVRIMGDPVLRRRAAEVARVDAEIRTLVADMFDTMYAEDGVGLAAPQIGESVRVVVIDAGLPDVVPFALINPVIVEHSAQLDRGEEGCLSIPGLREIVERPVRVVVEGLERDGEAIRLEAEGLLARIIQHEVDHIDGVLFIDRVSALKRRMLLAKWQKTLKAEQR
jgi:peptide deformylase